MKLGEHSRLTTPPERRIIDRPRLLKQLEETNARTILLIAPAGYGKTTLARQWARGRNVAWFAASLRSADVASLSRGIALSLTAFAPDLVAQVDETLRAMQNPARELPLLGELFISHLSQSSDSWFVIDDYQALESSAASEQVVEAIARSKCIRLLVSSRTRPQWVTTREHIYGDIFELRADDLALDEPETAQVLSNSRLAAQIRREIVDRAHGWPAVIGLAARAGAPGAPPREVLSQTLYDFLAEESFNSAPTVTQDALITMALLPSLDAGVLASIFGDQVSVITTDAARTGLLDLFHHSIELHPLARGFLFDRLRRSPDAGQRVRDAIDHAIAQNAWDEAFALIEAFEIPGELDRLMTAAFAPLLAEGRLETLERYMHHAIALRRGASPLIDLIGAEIDLRDGLLDQAQTLAVSAAEQLVNTHPLKARGYILAGASALARFNVSESYAFHSLALDFTQTTKDERDALWGQCLALIYLEDSGSVAAVHRLGRISGASPEDRLRAATAELLVSRLKTGFLDVGAAVDAENMISQVRDPRARTSYGNVCSYVLALQAQYDAADDVVNAALADAETYHLTFAKPHLHWTKALIALGRRRFSDADAHLRSAGATAARGTISPYVELNTRALRARILLTQHRGDEAVAITAGVWDSIPTREMYGEYLATQALALAVAGNASAARQSMLEARSITSAVEVQSLGAIAGAIAAIGTPRAVAAAVEALDVAIRLNTWDALVCGVRAAPELLTNMAAEKATHRHLNAALWRSHDESLLRASGLNFERSYRRGGVLSRREREVIDLLQQGLTNREIAQMLYISESTAKVHVHHILEKLRARSRAEAVARYALMADEASGGSSNTGSTSK